MEHTFKIEKELKITTENIVDCVLSCEAGGTGEAVFTVKNKTEARARGRLYIRQWQLPNGKIEYIRELAEGEEAVKFGRAAGY